MSNLQGNMWKIKQFSLKSGSIQDARTPIWLKTWVQMKYRRQVLEKITCCTIIMHFNPNKSFAYGCFVNKLQCTLSPAMGNDLLPQEWNGIKKCSTKQSRIQKEITQISRCIGVKWSSIHLVTCIQWLLNKESTMVILLFTSTWGQLSRWCKRLDCNFAHWPCFMSSTHL